MKDKRFICMILIFIIIVSLIVRQNYLANKWHQYSNRDISISLRYPARWFNVGPSKLPSWKYIALCTMDFPVLDAIELRIYSDKVTNWPQSDIASFGIWLINKNSKNTKIIEQRKVVIGKGGYPGVEIEYEDKKFHGKMVVLKYRGIIYAIEIHALKKKWNEANSIFDAILSTVEFLE